MRTTPRALAPALFVAVVALATSACTPAPPATGTAVDAPVPEVPASTMPAPAQAPASEAASGPTIETPCAPSDASVDAAEPRVHAYSARESIRACVTLRTQAEGERRTAVYSSYRPDVRLTQAGAGDEAPTTVRCALRFDPDGAIEPGSTVATVLSCEAPLEIGSDAPGFTLVEGGREVGTGTVVLPPG